MIPSLFKQKKTEKPKKNNIIFILIDDMGWKDLGCYGSDYYETPRIDKLADNGVRFTQAYAAHATCSPTRASIMTGCYPARVGISSFIPGILRPHSKLNPPQEWPRYLKMSYTTYAEVFRDNGYKTFHAGKWHLGELGPEYHGFDYVVDNKYNTINPEDPKNVMYFTEKTIEFIKKNNKDPFIAVLSHNTVHVPLEVRPELETKYLNRKPGSNGQNNEIMGGMIEYLDNSIGVFMNRLEDMGIMDHTYIIFFSDNGGLENVEGRIATSNLPLRRGKSQFYEGGIRVPMIVTGPGLPKGHVVDYPVISNDLFPTMLSMAGIELMPEVHRDGLSLMPLLTREKNALERKNLFWHYPHYQTMPPHGAVRSGDWKMVENYENGKIELFNLKDDLSESHDLSAQLPQVVGELKELFNDHLKEVNAPMPTLNYNYNPAKDGRSSEYYNKRDEREFQQTEYLEIKEK
ncbi:MAG: sulfatase [Bacteroidales bacterium]|nr:sulfatase [Bacteroidales bacterium]